VLAQGVVKCSLTSSNSRAPGSVISRGQGEGLLLSLHHLTLKSPNKSTVADTQVSGYPGNPVFFGALKKLKKNGQAVLSAGNFAQVFSR
jgi:hypothetical protein